MTWLPSRSGRTIELLEPKAEQVDFADLAWSLAHLNRYSGHGVTPVSVALHTLIGLDLCPEPLRAHWVLHDGHEWALGEITTPAQETLFAIAGQLAGSTGADVFAETIREFKARHDRVIHAAAGVPLPTKAQKADIKAIDLRCLATEHRDFHTPSQRSWVHEAMGIAPAKRLRKWQAPDKVADELHARFKRYLPALREPAI